MIVSGGRKITGTHRVSGNKNAALPMIAAALLTSEPVTLTNLPAIDDVERMLEVAKNFGVKVTRKIVEIIPKKKNSAPSREQETVRTD